MQSETPGFLVYCGLCHTTPESLARVSARVLEASAPSLQWLPSNEPGLGTEQPNASEAQFRDDRTAT